MEVPQDKEKKTLFSDSSYVTDSEDKENGKLDDGSSTSDDEYREEFSKIIHEKVNNKVLKLMKRDIRIRPSKNSEALLKNLAKSEGLKKKTVDSSKVSNSKNNASKVNKSKETKIVYPLHEKVNKTVKRRALKMSTNVAAKKREKSPESTRLPQLASTSKKPTKKSPPRIVPDKKKTKEKQKSDKKKVGGKVKVKGKKVQQKRVSFFPEVIEIQNDQYDGRSASESSESDSREESSSSMSGDDQR